MTENTPQDRSFGQDNFKARLNAVLLFIGTVFLIDAVAARFLFDSDVHWQILGMCAAILLGAPLVIQAIRDLLAGHMAMNELAALGVIAAFADGQYITAAVIALFMIIAVLIEYRTALGARQAIEQLVRLTPTRAVKITDTGEQEIEARDLQPGDRVRIRPGDNVPGDGRIVLGATTIDQANITGESLPVEKTVDDEVFGGTINMTGLIEVQILKHGTDTTLGKVQQLILHAEQSRTPIMRLTEQYARWYTPLILMIAGVVLFFTRNMDTAIAMLILACPGAIILSAPTAMVAALSAAARCGVLIKDVKDLEIARKLTAIVFDKTGTLTTGKLAVTRIKPAEGVDGADLLLTAATAEQNSRHPVARAIVEVAKKARLQLPQTGEFEEVAGKGVIAQIDNQTVRIGRQTWLADQGISVDTLDATDAEGLSLLFVVRADQPMGWIGLEDKTRSDAAAALSTLRELNIKQLIMMTGDRWSVAKKVAAAMGCTGVQAEVLPDEKLSMIDGLKQAGHTVAMVGDGVNDAPALAAGNLSIAMGAAGSDVAIESASIALMNNNLNRIPFLITLSRQSVAVVKQNLIFSIVFILAMETLAAMALVPPMLAVLLHVVADFVVIFNSARLVRAGEDLPDVAPEDEQKKNTVKAVAVTPA